MAYTQRERRVLAGPVAILDRSTTVIPAYSSSWVAAVGSATPHLRHLYHTAIQLSTAQRSLHAAPTRFCTTTLWVLKRTTLTLSTPPPPYRCHAVPAAHRSVSPPTSQTATPRHVRARPCIHPYLPPYASTSAFSFSLLVSSFCRLPRLSGRSRRPRSLRRLHDRHVLLRSVSPHCSPLPSTAIPVRSPIPLLIPSSTLSFSSY